MVRRSPWNSMVALAAVTLFFCTASARATVFQIDIINAVFSANCIGGGVCTETVHGSFQYDTVANSASNLSLHLTGTLAGLLNTYDPINQVLDDSGAVSTPIAFGPDLSTFNAPTSTPLVSGPNGTNLIVPALCGGDQPNCNAVGSFPTGSFNLFSGSYTSTALPEPGSLPLVSLGFLGLPLVALRVKTRQRTRRK